MDFSNFFTELLKALGGTLYFVIGAPETNKNIDWSQVLMTMVIKLTIICILILFFYGIYKMTIKVIPYLVQRFGRSDRTQNVLVDCAKYFWWFTCAIIILSQAGVSYPFIKSAVRSVFVGGFFYLLWMFINPILENLFTRYELNPSLKQLIRNISSVLIIIIAIGALMKQFGFDLISIVAGLGIVGIAVGFAAQSTLADFIAGVTILIERPFNIGDWVTINDHTGKIERISLRTTHIRTRTNMSVILPNNNVASAEIINLSARQLSAYQIPFGIAYEADADKARNAIISHVKENYDLVLNTPEPVIRIVELADSGVNMVMLYWIAKGNIDKQEVIHAELLETIKKLLDSENIEIPYPHVQLMQNK